jgi:RNase H-fold protein (predicted Holliday junction resolvase)
MSVEPSATANLPCVLAIDPGSAKCGVAVVQADGTVLYRAIITVDSTVEETRTLVARYRPVVVLMGRGTGSKPALKLLEEAELGSPLCPVDETRTSEEARARFVAENPARGWERLLPRSLRTPTQPYDDYVAVILAERYWQSTSAETS